MKRWSKWFKKYFIPHGENDFKPHFLRHESMMFSLLVVILIELAFLVQVFIVFDKTNFLAAILPGVLTTLTNEERAQNNAAPLTKNDLLTQAAQLKANDMASKGYFAHVSPDGKTPWYWLDQVGYVYSSAGENLAINFFESRDVAEAWMNSPSHRENMVKKNYTEIGIAVASGMYEGRNTVFVAQFFGTPLQVYTPPIIPVASASTKPPTPVTAPKPAPVTPTPRTPPPTPTPVVTPPPIVVTAPTEIQILGEETNSPVVTTTNNSTLLNIKLFVQKVLASPREYVTYVFGGIIFLIILALLLVLFIKSEITHPFIIARGAALMAIIFLLLFVNIKVLHFETEVPAEGLSASVIAY